MNKILFASNNRGKYDELANDFKNEGVDLVFYADVNLPKLELPEDYEILSENAREKASKAAQDTGYYTLGDDSGVFIEELEYFPGVHSRRWSCSEMDDHGRNQKILTLMEGEKNRNTYLISCFSLVSPDGLEIAKTKVKNTFTISQEEKGEYGFGYDNILIPSEENVQNSNLSEERKQEIINNQNTIAELTQEEKNAINNRGRIAKDISEKFFDYLEKDK